MCEQNKHYCQTQSVKMAKIGVQQSTLCYNFNHYKNKRNFSTTKKQNKKAYRKRILAKKNDKNTKI